MAPRLFDRFHAARTAASLLGVGLLLAVGGCGSEATEEPREQAGGGTDAPRERDIVERVKASTVAVFGDNAGFHSHGTGVIINADRNLVLTSGHAVDNARALTVTIDEKTTVKGRVVARAQCENLALIALFPEQDGLIELTPGDSDSVAAGDPVMALSYTGLAKTEDGKEKLAVTEGRVSVTGASTELTPLLPAFPSLIAHQAPLTVQSAGSPLLDAKGNWVGLNLVIPESAAAEGPDGVFYAVPTSRIQELMSELTPGETSFFAGWEKYHACHREMAKLARRQEVPDHDAPPDKGAKRGGGGGDAHSGDGKGSGGHD